MNCSSHRLGQAIVSIGLGLLCACSSGPQQSSSVEADPAAAGALGEGCPPPTAVLPRETVEQRYHSGQVRYFDRFDYAPKDIVLDENTVRFLAREYDFVYCRTDDSWTVQPGTLGEGWIAQLDALHQEQTEFSTGVVDGQSYQYRVVRDRDDPAADAPTQAVVLELMLPGQETPQRYPLYTLAAIEQAVANEPTSEPRSVKLGPPRITSAQVYGDRLWWTVAAFQGEGNEGIATIASYDPATDEMTLIQPDEIWSQQILDLAFTGTLEEPTLWMGVKVSGEAMSDVPATGLVAYQPTPDDLTSGTVQSYTPQNSPLVGTIPTQVAVDADQLWVGTRNGACQFNWQAPDQADSWDCWQFIAEAKIPEDEAVSVYGSLLSQTPESSLGITSPGETVEVLWWMFTEAGNPPQGRYEVRLEEGLAATVEQGASPILEPKRIEIAGQVPLYWPGYPWYWRGDRFVRPLDGALNDTISGDTGIGLSQTGPVEDWNAIRGDLELLALSAESTQVRYYSGWVEDEQLVPFPAVVKQSPPSVMQPNPLVEIDRQLRQPE